MITKDSPFSHSSTSRFSTATTRESSEPRFPSFIFSTPRELSRKSLKDLESFALKIANFQQKEATERSVRSPIFCSIKKIESEHKKDIENIKIIFNGMRKKHEHNPYIAAQLELLYKKIEKKPNLYYYSSLRQQDKQSAINNVENLYKKSLLKIELETILKDHLSTSEENIENPRVQKSLENWSRTFSSIEEGKLS